jgi:16S rRNA (guanine527-N7)-methyltransferase
MKNILPILKTALVENQFSLDEDIEKKLVRYLELVQTWNRVFNLTAITEPKEMVYLHIIDSLSVQPYLHGTHMLDVGTGAGLPGLPLAIINPGQQWYLLDKNSKKTRFLTQCIAELSLTNVQVVHSRSEDFHPAQCFDSILSRALATLHIFVETTKHLLCSDGKWIAMKGKYPQDEINDVPDRFCVQDILRVDIKGIDIERHLIRLRFADVG